MNILIGFKVEPDFTMIPEFGWTPDSHGNIDTSYVRKITNCYDESAAELALNFREKTQSLLAVPAVPTVPTAPIKLTALCLGAADSEFSLHPLLALGFDAAVRVDLPADHDLRFNPHVVAKTFAAWHQTREAQSLIVLGAQSGEGANGQTPALVAEFLQWPCFSQVTGFLPTLSEEIIRITRKTETGEQTLDIRLPAVLSIGNSPDSAYLRMPTLMQKLAARHRTVTQCSLSDLGVDLATPPLDKRLMQLKRHKKTRQTQLIDGGTVAEKTQRLCDDFLKVWLTP